MREIDLGEEVKLKIKIADQFYVLREPTQADVEILQDTNESKAFVNFICKLGMPKDVAEGLGLIRLKKLSDSLTEALTEKK